MGILREGYITVNIIGALSVRCYRVLPHLSQMLLNMSTFQAESPYGGCYNERGYEEGLERAIGITIVKNIQIINNYSSNNRQFKNEKLIAVVLNRLTK